MAFLFQNSQSQTNGQSRDILGIGPGVCNGTQTREPHSLNTQVFSEQRIGLENPEGSGGVLSDTGMTGGLLQYMDGRQDVLSPQDPQALYQDLS